MDKDKKKVHFIDVKPYTGGPPPVLNESKINVFDGGMDTKGNVSKLRIPSFFPVTPTFVEDRTQIIRTQFKEVQLTTMKSELSIQKEVSMGISTDSIENDFKENVDGKRIEALEEVKSRFVENEKNHVNREAVEADRKDDNNIKAARVQDGLEMENSEVKKNIPLSKFEPGNGASKGKKNKKKKKKQKREKRKRTEANSTNEELKQAWENRDDEYGNVGRKDGKKKDKQSKSKEEKKESATGCFGFIATWWAKRKEAKREKKRKAIEERKYPKQLVEYDRIKSRGGVAFTLELDDRPMKKLVLPPIKQRPGPIRLGTSEKLERAEVKRTEELKKKKKPAKEHEIKKAECHERKADKEFYFKQKVDLTILHKQSGAKRNRKLIERDRRCSSSLQLKAPPTAQPSSTNKTDDSNDLFDF